MIDEILQDAGTRMDKSIEALQQDLRTIRTGRATPALVEHISVTYFGMPTPLQQLAVIGVPEPRLITIRPFSPGDIGEIQKAIQRSDLGITPSNDGKIIRLVVPPLTEERRHTLVRQVKSRAEEARTAIRNIRRDANKMIEDAEEEKVVTEDEMHRGFKQVQELVDSKIGEIDAVARDKEEEILEI